MIIALAGSAFAFTAVACFLLWAAGAQGVSQEARLSRLALSVRPSTVDSPFSERVVIPIISSLARILVQVLPHTFVRRVGQQLISAGQPMGTQGFFTVVVLMGVFFPASVLALVLMLGDGKLSVVGLVVVSVMALLGGLLPFLWLRRRVRSRKLAIWKSLPDVFDLVTVSVEAGLGLDAALRQVAEKLKGPLADEIRQTLREVAMGRPRRQALEDMAERGDVKELTTFVNAVIQAEHLGTSVGRVLRAQGVTLRVHRRQRAEEIARKAPVKMVFPLVLFIMPTFFIVTLGPIIIHLVKLFSEN